MLSKSLIQFSVDGWGCVPSLLFTWGQIMMEVMKIMVTSCYTQCPQPCSRPPPTHTSAGDSWTLAGKSGSVSCVCVCVWGGGGHCSFLLDPGAHKVLFMPSKSLFPQSCVSSDSPMWG